jgi:16S rRNA (cytosine967-C5)-methyltransferase
MELAYGAIRLRTRLDTEIGHFSNRSLDRLDPGVLDWLRLGLYQLRETRIPDHAAVDESVEGAARTENRGAAGFVNAVLRSAVREDPRPDLFPSFDEDPLEHLVLHGSHPEWIVRRWLDRWPADRVRELVALDNRPPRVTGRWLTPDGAPPADLPGHGVEVRVLEPWPRAFRLEAGEPGELLARAPAVIQDPAASAVVDYLGRADRKPLVDACAGPGGKAVALAGAGGAGTTVVAGDVSRDRLLPIVEAAGRVGVPVRPVVMDARRPAVARAGPLLLDVPCTGTGTLRRRPDARWRIDRGRLEAAVRLQEEILEAASALVPDGSTVVYATCSLEPEENEEQVRSFLERHPEFRRLPPPDGSGLPADVIDEEGALAVRPWAYGTDGSYAARLGRREGRP